VSELRPARIVVVDDDETFRARLARALRARGHEVWEASDREGALLVARTNTPSRAVLDLRLAEESGLDLLNALRAAVPSIDCVMLTGYGSIPSAVDAVRRGAINYLTKPVDADDVLRAFEQREHAPASPEPEAWAAPSLGRLEWEHIHRVLVDCGGNVSRAARVLGLHRRTLQRKLRVLPPYR